MHQHPSASSTPTSQLLGLAAALRRNGGRLALFAVVCTALIAITDYFTRDVIARQAEQQLQQTLQQMLPAHSYDNDLAGSCILLQNREYLGNDAPHPVYVARQGDRIWRPPRPRWRVRPETLAVLGWLAPCALSRRVAGWYQRRWPRPAQAKGALSKAWPFCSRREISVRAEPASR